MFSPPLSLRKFLAIGTALSLALPCGAFAQTSGAAPPGRVGQISALSGSVSFDGSGSGGWAAAAQNYPVSAGDSLYTQSASRATMTLDSSQIDLAATTELQVTTLDDRNFAATLSQGEAAFAVNDLQSGQSFDISTPRGMVAIGQNGQYDIVAGDADTPTLVNVYQGAAEITDPGVDLQVPAGQSGVLSGADRTVAQLGQAQQDSFTSAVFAAASPPPPAYAPPVVAQMTGSAELAQYGSWQQNAQYGAVWYPSVGSGWAPYQEGHWAYIDPWGWTWVDNEPWGFAPFHYGRWFDDGGRWGWAPAPAYQAGDYGPSYQPVYAPAVVSFFGLALAAGITAAAFSSGSVGWVPLAPNEPYYPSYNAPAAYIRQINYVNVRNINDVHITNYYGAGFSPDRLANRRAAIFVPAGVMTRGEHVAGFGHAPYSEQLAGARNFVPHPGERADAAGQGAGFRLPPAARPMAETRPGAAPRRSAFADRRSLPPATLSHTPFQGRPVPASESPGAHASPAIGHPDFATAPGFHAPPPPPALGQHLAPLPPAAGFHPAPENRPVPSLARPEERAPMTAEQPGMAGRRSAPEARSPLTAERPPEPAYHPQAPAYHPQTPAYHPPAPAYHPAQPAYHPPAPAYHPPAPAYHPPAPADHPPAPRPQAAPPPRPAPPPHPQPNHEPGHPG